MGKQKIFFLVVIDLWFNWKVYVEFVGGFSCKYLILIKYSFCFFGEVWLEMGTKSTHGPICFLFERQIWFVNYCKGSRVLLVLRRYIVSWREYFGWPWPEVIFFGKHGDEKFDISFVIRCKLLASVLLWNSFPWLLHSKALRTWWKNYFTHKYIVLILLLGIFL